MELMNSQRPASWPAPSGSPGTTSPHCCRVFSEKQSFLGLSQFSRMKRTLRTLTPKHTHKHKLVKRIPLLSTTLGHVNRVRTQVFVSNHVSRFNVVENVLEDISTGQ